MTAHATDAVTPPLPNSRSVAITGTSIAVSETAETVDLQVREDAKIGLHVLDSVSTESFVVPQPVSRTKKTPKPVSGKKTSAVSSAAQQRQDQAESDALQSMDDLTKMLVSCVKSATSDIKDLFSRTTQMVADAEEIEAISRECKWLVEWEIDNGFVR